MSDYSELKTAATRVVEVQTSQDVPISKLFDEFDALASPEVVLELIAEVKGLRTIAYGVSGAHRVEMYDEIARLKAEVESLRKDAERYRFLKSLPMASADDEVDAAMSKGDQP